MVSSMKEESVQNIDSDVNHLRVKAPLLMFALGSGILSSMTTSFIKGVSEQAADGGLVKCLALPMIYVLLALVGLSLVF